MKVHTPHIVKVAMKGGCPKLVAGKAKQSGGGLKGKAVQFPALLLSECGRNKEVPVIREPEKQQAARKSGIEIAPVKGKDYPADGKYQQTFLESRLRGHVSPIVVCEPVLSEVNPVIHSDPGIVQPQPVVCEPVANGFRRKNPPPQTRIKNLHPNVRLRQSIENDANRVTVESNGTEESTILSESRNVNCPISAPNAADHSSIENNIVRRRTIPIKASSANTRTSVPNVGSQASMENRGAGKEPGRASAPPIQIPLDRSGIVGWKYTLNTNVPLSQQLHLVEHDHLFVKAVDSFAVLRAMSNMSLLMKAGWSDTALEVPKNPVWQATKSFGHDGVVMPTMERAMPETKQLPAFEMEMRIVENGRVAPSVRPQISAGGTDVSHQTAPADKAATEAQQVSKIYGVQPILPDAKQSKVVVHSGEEAQKKKKRQSEDVSPAKVPSKSCNAKPSVSSKASGDGQASKQGASLKQNPGKSISFETTIKSRWGIQHDNVKPLVSGELNTSSPQIMHAPQAPVQSGSRWDNLIQFVEKIMRSARVTHHAEGMSELKVHMDSKSLGRITIQVSVADNNVDVRFTLDSVQARNILQTYRSELVQIIKDSGASTVNIDVSTSSTDGERRYGTPSEARDWSDEQMPPMSFLSEEVEKDRGMGVFKDTQEEAPARNYHLDGHSSMVWVA
jgi:flagellar hook-length control protein FliK